MAKFGGFAIYTATILSISISINLSDFTMVIIVLGSVAFLIGLYDDIVGIFPSLKMLFFICLAIFCFNFEIKLFPSLPLYISLPFTIFWISGIINAINLIDNMDGLSSGVSSITLCFISYLSFYQGNEVIFTASLALLGACLGFLIFNFYPAKIFMGDSGSLFIGLILSILSLKVAGNATNIFSTLLVPTMLLLFPIFDTTLVTINRILNKTPISKGGVDHTSHRLVGFGLSEKRVVILLYFVSIVFGLVAIIFQQHGFRTWTLIFLITLSGLGITGLFLSYYKNSDPEYLKYDKNRNFVFDRVILYKKQILEVLFDSIIIAMCFTFSHYLRFEDNVPKEIWMTHDKTIGWIITIKILTFYIFGLYKGIWKYASIPDLINCLKASAMASTSVIIFVMFFYKDISFSRSIIFIDFLLTFIFVSGFRIFYRILSEIVVSININKKGERTLIVGAGQLGQLILRQILAEDSDHNYYPVGMLDDKPSLRGRNLFDIPIFGSIDSYKKVIEKNDISTVLCTINNKSTNCLEKYCKDQNITFLQVSINI